MQRFAYHVKIQVPAFAYKAHSRSMVSTNIVVYNNKEDVQTQFQTDAVFHISVRLRRKESLGFPCFDWESAPNLIERETHSNQELLYW